MTTPTSTPKVPDNLFENLQQAHQYLEQVLGFVATELDRLTANNDVEGRLDYEDAMESATAVVMNIETLIMELRRIQTPTTGV